jgi:hypothetical protein
MTLNLLTQIPEGLIMLSDSMVSAQWTINGERERVNFQHARKLFHLGEKFPAAAMINGDGAIGSAPLSQLLRDASRHIDAHEGTVDHDACLGAVTERISPVYDEFVVQLREETAKEIAADPAALSQINKKRKQAGHSPLSSITPDMIGVAGLTQEKLTVTEIVPPEFTVIVGSYFAKPLVSLIVWPGVAREDLITETGGSLWWWGSGSVPLMRLINSRVASS